jgi:hypothetical protein
VVRLGQPSIGALDVVDGRAAGEAEGSVRVGVERHRQRSSRRLVAATPVSGVISR